MIECAETFNGALGCGWPMRRLMLAMLIASSALAGCLTADDSDSLGAPAFDLAGTNDSHPAFGFPTANSLPEGDEDLPVGWAKLPARALPETLEGLTSVAHVPGVPSGAGVAVFGHLGFVGAYDTDSLQVVNLMDPENPEVVGEVAARAGDVDTIAYPNGRLVAVTATRGENMLVVDVTDPTQPEIISVIETGTGNHNLAVVPGTPVLYNAASKGAGVGTEIYDLSDPVNPVLVQTWENGYSCHAQSFLIDRELDLYRGYCAGVQYTQIWNLTDPLNPSVISEIPFPVAGLEAIGEQTGGIAPVNFAHLAMANHNGTILIVGDETGGGAGPGCDVYAHAAGSTLSGPLGNLWFYDITDEANPVLKGGLSVNAFDAVGSCTAHFGSVIEDTNHLVMAFYTGGVALVDFTDAANPVIKDQWNARGPADACSLCATWDAWYYQGYVFAGDIDRGMDIISFV